MPNQPNIIWITFDSGRADHMSFAGYTKNTTPFLKSLAEKSTVFMNAFSTGPGSSVSFTGMFTSTYPLDYGGYSYIDCPRVLMSEALKEAGYTTIGLHSSPYLSEYFGYNRGWDTYSYLNYFKRPGGSVVSPGNQRGTAKAKMLQQTAASHGWLKKYLPPVAVLFKLLEKFLLLFRKLYKDARDFKPAFYTGEEMNTEIAKALDAYGEKAIREKPLFLWYHYLDAHVPYGLFYRKGRGILKSLKYHACDIALFLFGEISFLNRLFKPLYLSCYDDSLRYVDECIEKMLAELRARGIVTEDTVIIVNADHGEAFFEHGAWGHEQRLYNENINVPLIVRTPGHVGERILRPVSLIDLAPTILELAGAKRPASYKGKNIFDSAERDVVSQASESAGNLTDCQFTGVALIASGHKFFAWKDEKHLFAFDDVAEEKDLYGEKRALADELERRAAAYAPDFESKD